eukprot:1494108-Prorocentrum_lima.AAC.1
MVIRSGNSQKKAQPWQLSSTPASTSTGSSASPDGGNALLRTLRRTPKVLKTNCARHQDACSADGPDQ